MVSPCCRSSVSRRVAPPASAVSMMRASRKEICAVRCLLMADSTWSVLTLMVVSAERLHHAICHSTIEHQSPEVLGRDVETLGLSSLLLCGEPGPGIPAVKTGLDAPPPRVSPPLKIKVEYAAGMEKGAVDDLAAAIRYACRHRGASCDASCACCLPFNTRQWRNPCSDFLAFTNSLESLWRNKDVWKTFFCF